ncbi:MAG: hypothetical protein DHS20C02_07070 [Micavibrio sp.]|nr:MAG: hypothetical protein DHS20C02_07070 [Micavibrio sp.]
MYSLRPLVGLFFVIILLAGCSHFDSDEEEMALEEEASEQIILYQQGEGDQALRPQPIPQYNISASSLSNANVQVFSVDGAPGPGLHSLERPATTLSTPGGSNYATGGAFSDPSVQVFPLDDAMARSMGLLPGSVPSGMPAQKPKPVEQIDLSESRPVSLVPGVEPAPQDDFVALSVPGHDAIRIYFEHDSAKLDEGDIGAITTAAERHTAAGGSVLNVEGHASMEASINDPIKRKIVNLKVSMDRAFTVARKLIEKGVPGDMIRAAGWGDARSSAPADGLDTESASRRVEISSASSQ